MRKVSAYHSVGRRTACCVISTARHPRNKARSTATRGGPRLEGRGVGRQSTEKGAQCKYSLGHHAGARASPTERTAPRANRQVKCGLG